MYIEHTQTHTHQPTGDHDHLWASGDHQLKITCII
jgi:hypothetical protein